jgi:hypothetical protein
MSTVTTIVDGGFLVQRQASQLPHVQPGSYFEATGGDWVLRRSMSDTLSDGSYGCSMPSPTSRLCYKSLSDTVLM